ncbi:MAG: energy transducer TonB [Bacteroidota bacterium]|nr:energy transducer TonB [Bacteroidota bacterium]
MKPVLIICFSLVIFSTSAQDKNQFFALDAKMNQTILDSSKYILWIHKQDSNWQWDYYKTWGPMVKSYSYADHDGTMRNGDFYLYNTSGALDSMGYFDHGKKKGSFYKLRTLSNDSIIFFKQYEYEQDSLLKTVDLSAEKAKNNKADSMKEQEAGYPGGEANWQTFLSQNLKYPERAMTKGLQGQVRICFMVDEEGNVKNPFVQKSVEYSLDQESLKLIRDSGNWIPGTKDNNPVKTYKVQPVNFKLQTQ